MTKDPNSTSSSNTNYSLIGSPTWQPNISNTSRITAYIHNNKPKRTLTLDRTIPSKRKILTPTKLHVLTTKQDSLTAFRFRAKVTTPSHNINAIPIDKTRQHLIQDIKPFDTNEFKGDKLILLDPNHIRIFYINSNGIKLGQGGNSLLQLSLTLKEKGVDIVCLTKTNVHWARDHVYHKFRQTPKDTWQKHKISVCTSESDIT